MKKILVSKGEKFGRLTVISEVARKLNSRAVLFSCDCGKLKEIRLQDVLLGKTTSCGCFNRENAARRHTTHGRSKDPVYRVWASMVERCSDPACRYYPRYGGRGIEVCDEWLTFENFIRDMGERPKGETRYTVERINNSLGYSKLNCKWATYVEQANNKSSNVMITFSGRTHNLTQWCKELNVPFKTMAHRLRSGWCIEEAFSTPYPSPHRVSRKPRTP